MEFPVLDLRATTASLAAAAALLLVAAPASAQQQPWQQPQQQGQQQQQQEQPQQPQPSSGGYRLTLPAIETCHTAMMTLLKRAQADPALRAEQASQTEPDGTTPEQIADFMKKQAPASSALMASSGCPAETYVKIGLATMEAVEALNPSAPNAPPANLAPMARENAAFLQQNATRLQQIDQEAAAAENGPQMSQGR
ncbi:MAG: hypothetical protein JWM77_499 [Rhodospirillales bacterium]|nr:hypothetical protein [Rhodospirillales bacterium]